MARLIGKSIGLLEGAKETTLDVLKIKLGKVPKTLKEQIKAETDREKLKKLRRELILATDPIEVIQRFGYSVNFKRAKHKTPGS
ncbi:MAG: hypothetical protein NZ526_08030 [Aquificaceae bacterium]|nr:hypothetical protein [Aquificaceae bacterium]